MLCEATWRARRRPRTYVLLGHDDVMRDGLPPTIPNLDGAEGSLVSGGS